MRTLVLILISVLSLASSSAFAASYQRTDGTIVDPIPRYPIGSGDHPYSGINLEPGADLAGADLTGADLLYADLTDANLTGAILANASWLGSITGSPFYNATTDFTGAWADGDTTPFDPVAAGWTLVPEPSTALLIGLGLASLAKRASRN